MIIIMTYFEMMNINNFMELYISKAFDFDFQNNFCQFCNNPIYYILLDRFLIF